MFVYLQMRICVCVKRFVFVKLCTQLPWLCVCLNLRAQIWTQRLSISAQTQATWTSFAGLRHFHISSTFLTQEVCTSFIYRVCFSYRGSSGRSGCHRGAFFVGTRWSQLWYSLKFKIMSLCCIYKCCIANFIVTI